MGEGANQPSSVLLPGRAIEERHFGHVLWNVRVDVSVKQK